MRMFTIVDRMEKAPMRRAEEEEEHTGVPRS